MILSEKRSPSVEKIIYTWEDVEYLFNELCNKCAALSKNYDTIVSIGRGGNFPATYLSYKLDKKLLTIDNVRLIRTWLYPKFFLLIDDVLDTGYVLNEIKDAFENKNKSFIFASLIRKPWSPSGYLAIVETDKWVEFPWCPNH